MGQLARVLVSQLEATSQKENKNKNQNRLILELQNYLFIGKMYIYLQSVSFHGSAVQTQIIVTWSNMVLFER